MLNTLRIQSVLSELITEYQMPSAVIGVLHDGTISDFAVGVKDLSTHEPAATDTIYQCGSLSKTWTALAFMQLVDEARVDLDAPVRAYIPSFHVADAEVSDKVTPRHLLNHTHGIEEYFGNPGEGENVYERMVENIAAAPQVHPLGYTHGYSAALGYAILARIMEIVDGKRWDAIMHERLFAPLGLTSTTSWRQQVDDERAATGYVIRSPEEGPIMAPVRYLPRSYGPGGNISSTVGEVLMLAGVFLGAGVALNGRRIVSPEIVREMMDSRVPIPDPYMFGPWWALGLIVCDWHGRLVYAHDGSTIGQHARLRILPDSNIAIALLANGGPRRRFYEQAFNEMLRELGADTIPGLPEPDSGVRLETSRYEGVYARPGTRFEVRSRGRGELGLTHVLDPKHAQITGKPNRIDYQLLPISETHFLMPSVDPLEDTQTVAIYDFKDGSAQYLHTNARVFPRVTS